MATILIIDDDFYIREVLEDNIAVLGHEAVFAKNLSEGRRLTENREFDLVFLDVCLPDGNGLEAVPGIREGPGAPEIIIITGAGDTEGAELAIGSGAWDYIQKPFSMQNIRLQVQRVLEYRNRKREKKRTVSLKRDRIIGCSPRLNACLDRVARCADSDTSVFVSGETGTGKELFARAIHENSSRADRPFVVVDCASLPDQLVETLLFGHEKGAFTGAHCSKTGLISEAHGGTLFLDEVGELPLTTQKNFLRVLQERRYRPVGNRKEFHSDFRLISATNRNIEERVRTGRFRKDLLYRLRSFVLELPPLRDRKEDIKPLTLHYIFLTCRKRGIQIKGMVPEFLGMLESCEWPGNIRELIGSIEEAVLAEPENPVLYPMHLPPRIRVQYVQRSLETEKPSPSPLPAPKTALPQTDTSPDSISLPLSLKDYRKRVMEKGEQHYLEQLLAFTSKNIPRTCEISGLSKSRLYHLLKKYHISLK